MDTARTHFNDQISPLEREGVVYPHPEVTDENQDAREAADGPSGAIQSIPQEYATGCIRRFCVECMGGSWREVNTCPSTGCHLWVHRLGMRPATAREKHPDLMSPKWIREHHAAKNKGGK